MQSDFVLIKPYSSSTGCLFIIDNSGGKKVFSIHILVFISLHFLRHLFQHWFHAAWAKVCQQSLSFCSIIQHVLGSSTAYTVLIKENFTQVKKSNNLLFGKISGKNQDTALHLPENTVLPLDCRNIVLFFLVVLSICFSVHIPIDPRSPMSAIGFSRHACSW